MKQYLIGALITVLVIAGAFIVWQQRPDKVNQQTSAGQASSSAVLNLSNQGITKVGPEVYSKTATTELLLSNNSIKTLPSEMGKMTNLVIFKIDHNVLEGSLIGEVRQMSQLKTLDVSYNNMTGMPAEIGQLSKLETLNYSYNKVTGLPNELAGLKNNLKTFDLTGNPLSAAQIAKLKTELPNTTIVF